MHISTSPEPISIRISIQAAKATSADPVRGPETAAEVQTDHEFAESRHRNRGVDNGLTGVLVSSRFLVSDPGIPAEKPLSPPQMSNRRRRFPLRSPTVQPRRCLTFLTEIGSFLIISFSQIIFGFTLILQVATRTLPVPEDLPDSEHQKRDRDQNDQANNDVVCQRHLCPFRNINLQSNTDKGDATSTFNSGTMSRSGKQLYTR